LIELFQNEGPMGRMRAQDCAELERDIVDARIAERPHAELWRSRFYGRVRSPPAMIDTGLFEGGRF